jgi:hypothetical protein
MNSLAVEYATLPQPPKEARLAPPGLSTPCDEANVPNVQCRVCRQCGARALEVQR